MTGFLGSMRRLFFGLGDKAVSPERRGFDVSDPIAARHLEAVGRSFLHGYNAALLDTDPWRIARVLDPVDDLFRGFAYEGAAMALSILDLITPWGKSRFEAFLKGPGDAHIYMVYIGHGWALARLARRFEPHIAKRDPLLCWLLADGYGFHQAFFHPKKYLHRLRRPKKLRSGFGLNAFDQGLGRALWFVAGTNVPGIRATILRFDEARRNHLWSGIGLAATYAGGVSEEVLYNLREASGSAWPHLAQGACFAAEARLRADNLIPQVATACRIFCDLSPAEAAELTNRLRPEGSGPACYQSWRSSICNAFTAVPAESGAI